MAGSTIKIIYNDCYGGFLFSNAFTVEYEKRAGKPLNALRRQFQHCAESLRRDPIAIALLEEKGTEWSSGTCACLLVREIPAIFEHYWTIEGYDGNETVHVNVSEAYADLLHQYMETGDSGKLADGYRRVRAAAERLKEDAGYLTAGDLKTTAAATAVPTVSKLTGYGFFDNGSAAVDASTVKDIAGIPETKADGSSGYSFFDDGDDDTIAHD